MSFAEKLRRLRRDLGLSQDQMGERCGLHGRHVGRFETGGALPSAETVLAIARALDVSIDFLLRDEVAEPGGGSVPGDPEARRRLRQLETLPEEDRREVFALIDARVARRERPGRGKPGGGGADAPRARRRGARGRRGTGGAASRAAP
jgi:transcriptional regulator with XRE-family HTH domain